MPVWNVADYRNGQNVITGGLNHINVARTEKILEANPTMISSGCPYYITMISDST